MEKLIDEGSHYSKKIRTQLKNLLFVLTGAIIFSFLMGILSNIIVYHFVLNEPLTSYSFFLVEITIIMIVAISYSLYNWYVFVPYSHLTAKIFVPMIYNGKDGVIIDDLFDGYHPQKMAWQAFERFREKYQEIAEKRIKEGMPPKAAKKHILTELLEYLIVLNLSKELYGFDKKGLMPNKTIAKLPDGFEKNSFISFFKSLKPKDIVDMGMSQLEFNIPKDIAIKYWSPAPIKGLLPDPNTFKIGFVGKYCEIYLIGQCTSLMPIQSIQSGPAPIFEGVYIRRYFQDKLLEDSGKLRRITFHISVEAKFKLRYYLHPPLPYIEWAERWIDGFMKGTFFGGFDFEEFRKEKRNSMEYDMYETIKMIDVRIEDMEGKISNMEKS